MVTNMKKIKSKGNVAEAVYQTVCFIIVTVFALICLYPLLYAFFVSLVSKQEWSDCNGLLMFFPKNPTFAAYGKIFRTNTYILTSLGVAVLKTVLRTVGGALVAAILGYVLSRQKFPGKKLLTGIVIFTIFFGAGLIPNYMVVQELNLLNTIWALVLPCLLNTWYALIFKQFFSGLPTEVEESAYLDGTSELQMLWHIILPMSKPIFASISLFIMVDSWNSWFDAMIYIDVVHSNLWPLQYYVSLTFNNLTQVDQGTAGDWQTIVGTGNDVPDIAVQMALTIVSLLPILIAYPFFQKYFVKGVYMGAIK